jgi:nucleosome assembly protein 1-like 1
MAEDFDRTAAASIFAQNPALVSMIQGKLGTLVGRSSGYVENLPAPVRRRVAGLKGIQKEHAKLEAEFQEEVLNLEKKYFAKFTPLYQKRAGIVNGDSEPTEAEVEAGKAEGDEDEREDEKPEVKVDAADDTKGVPEFWLSAMKNQVSLAELITDQDEKALRHLTDIRMEYLDRPGFKLIFEFSPNDFFSNKTLSKTYFYREENGYGGDFIYDHAEGETIDWKPNKDLTVRVESKKQRNKSKSRRQRNLSGRLANPFQTPSKHGLSRRWSQPSLSSTSSRHPRFPRMTKMMAFRTLRSVWSWTISLERILRRS